MKQDDLRRTSYFSVQEIENYSQNTIGSIFDILLSAAGIKNIDCDHAFSHIAKGMGLGTFLRAAPFLRGKKEFNLPIGLFADAGCSMQDWFDGKYSNNFESVVYKLACDANNHFQLAKASLQKLDSPPIRLAFLAVRNSFTKDSNQDLFGKIGEMPV